MSSSAWIHEAERTSRANTPESPRPMMDEARETMHKELQLLRLRETAGRKREAELQDTVRSLQAQLDKYKRPELHTGAGRERLEEQVGLSAAGDGAHRCPWDEADVVAANAKMVQHTLSTLVHHLSPARKASRLAGSPTESWGGTETGVEERGKEPAHKSPGQRACQSGGNRNADADADALRRKADEAAQQARVLLRCLSFCL
jgi:hypothetical protein